MAAASPVAEWLDEISKGYSKFVEAFDEMGAADNLEQLRTIAGDEELRSELQDELKKVGAKSVHRRQIMDALDQLKAGVGKPAAPAVGKDGPPSYASAMLHPVAGGEPEAEEPQAPAHVPSLMSQEMDRPEAEWKKMTAVWQKEVESRLVELGAPQGVPLGNKLAAVSKKIPQELLARLNKLRVARNQVIHPEMGGASSFDGTGFKHDANSTLKELDLVVAKFMSPAAKPTQGSSGLRSWLEAIKSGYGEYTSVLEELIEDLEDLPDLARDEGLRGQLQTKLGQAGAKPVVVSKILNAIQQRGSKPDTGPSSTTASRWAKPDTGPSSTTASRWALPRFQESPPPSGLPIPDTFGSVTKSTLEEFADSLGLELGRFPEVRKSFLDKLSELGVSDVAGLMDLTPDQKRDLVGILPVAVRPKCREKLRTLEPRPTPGPASRREEQDTSYQLAEAVKRGNDAEVLKLLDAGADVQKLYGGYPPLYWSTDNDHESTCSLLISRGASVSTPGYNALTPLHAAANRGNDRLVQLFVDKGANLVAADTSGKTPEDLARANGHHATANLLSRLRAPAVWTLDRTDVSVKELRRAAESGRTGECIHLVRDKRVDPNWRTAGYYSLYWAAKNNHKDTCLALIAYGAEVDTAGNNDVRPLWAAAKVGAKDVVQVLVDKGASLTATDSFGKTPLAVAKAQKVMNNDLLYTIQLLERLESQGAGAQPNSTAPSPVVRPPSPASSYATAASGSTGSEGGATGGGGRPPSPAPSSRWDVHATVEDLTEAAGDGKDDEVERLVESGIDVNARNRLGFCALSAAAKSGFRSTVQLLIRLGANVEATDEKLARTSVAMAAFHGRADVIQVLIDAGASPSTPDIYQRTPVSSAVANGQMEALLTLVKNGADTELANKYGETPIDIARKRGLVDFKRVLIDAQAGVPPVPDPRAAEEFPPAPWVPAGVDRSGSGAPSPAVVEFVKSLDLFDEADEANFISVLVSADWAFTDPKSQLPNCSIEELAQLCDRLPLNQPQVRRKFNAMVNEFKKATQPEAQLETQRANQLRREVSDAAEALLKAAQYGDDAHVRALLDKKNPDQLREMLEHCDEKGFTAMHKASMFAHAHVVAILVEKGNDKYVDIEDQFGRTGLFLASGRGHTSMCELLITKYRCSLKSDGKGRTCLMNAAFHGKAETVKLLAKYVDPADRAYYGKSALQAAEEEQHPEVIQVLTELRLHAALLEACKQGSTDEVRSLIAQGGMNVNLCYAGSTPLAHAIRFGATEVALLLVDELGAIVDQKVNRFDETAVLLAAKFGNLDALQALVDRGADVAAVDCYGQNALHVASQSKRSERQAVVEYLVGPPQRVNINTQDAEGRTPLHSAALVRANREVVIFLAQNGADIHIADKWGSRPVDLAREFGEEATAEYLEYFSMKLR